MRKTSTVLITGASSGIGEAITLEFCKQFSKSKDQLNLMLTSKTKSKLLKLKTKLSSTNIKISTISCDLRKPKNVYKLHQHCIKTFGTLDCLINNVGIGIFKDFRKISYTDFDNVVSVNLKSVFFLSQLALKTMTKRKNGHIIFITSVAAEKPFEQSSLYCLSKFGQKGLLEVIRLYGRKIGVRVTNIMPGATYTQMWDRRFSNFQHKMLDPKDVAKCVVDSYFTPSNACMEEIIIRHPSGDIQDLIEEIEV